MVVLCACAVLLNLKFLTSSFSFRVPWGLCVYCTYENKTKNTKALRGHAEERRGASMQLVLKLAASILIVPWCDPSDVRKDCTLAAV